jgi:hypothetical protein
VAAALIALIAYALPHSSSPAAPVIIQTIVETPGSQQATAVPPATAPASSADGGGEGYSTAGLASPAPLVPPGCDDAFAAISAYNKNAGSTQDSQAAAAQETEMSMMSVSTENDAEPGMIMQDLACDFENMYFILIGNTSGSYSAAVAQTNSDIKTLDSVCAPN